MVRSTVRIVLPLEKAKQALGILSSVASRTRGEPGCKHFRIYLDTRNEGRVLIDQLWSTEENMKRHLRSEDYLDILIVMEMAVEAPEIRFDYISKTTGMETIEEARNVVVR